MKVYFPKKFYLRFQKYAKSRFPIESYAFLLGKFENNHCKIQAIVIPADQELYSTELYIDIPEHWYDIAREVAKENDLQIIGDIHSHCFSDISSSNMSAVQSEGDIDSQNHLQNEFGGGKFVFGILNLCKVKKNITSKLRFWPEIENLDVIL